MDQSSPGQKGPVPGKVESPEVPHEPSGGFHDIELLRLWQAGDQVAFEEVLTRHKSQLSAVLMSYLNNRTDVEDGLQDVWVRFLKVDLGRFDGDQHFLNTLMRAARQVAIDLLRKRGRWDKLATESTHGEDGSVPDDVANHPDDDPSPEETLLKGESAAEVRECVQRLDEATRDAVTLFYWYDLGYKEIAEVLGTPYGSTRRRIIRGLRQIADWIEENRRGK